MRCLFWRVKQSKWCFTHKGEHFNNLQDHLPKTTNKWIYLNEKKCSEGFKNCSPGIFLMKKILRPPRTIESACLCVSSTSRCGKPHGAQRRTGQKTNQTNGEAGGGWREARGSQRRETRGSEKRETRWTWKETWHCLMKNAGFSSVFLVDLLVVSNILIFSTWEDDPVWLAHIFFPWVAQPPTRG